MGDLSAEFGADGTATARNKHRLTLDKTNDLTGIDIDRIATEEVFNTDFAQAADADLTGNEFEHTGENLGNDACFFAGGDHPADDLPRSGGHGDNDVLDVIFGDQGRDIFQGAEDRVLDDGGTDFLGIIIDEAHQVKSDMAAGVDLTGNHLAGIPSANNEDPAGLAFFTHLCLLVNEQAEAETGAANDHQGDETIDERQGARQGVGSKGKKESNDQDGGEGNGLEDVDQGVDAGVGPIAAVEAEEEKNGDADEENESSVDQDGWQIIAIPGEADAQAESQDRGQGQEDDIGDKEITVAEFGFHRLGPLGEFRMDGRCA